MPAGEKLSAEDAHRLSQANWYAMQPTQERAIQERAGHWYGVAMRGFKLEFDGDAIAAEHGWDVGGIEAVRRFIVDRGAADPATAATLRVELLERIVREHRGDSQGSTALELAFGRAIRNTSEKWPQRP